MNPLLQIQRLLGRLADGYSSLADGRADHLEVEGLDGPRSAGHGATRPMPLQEFLCTNVNLLFFLDGGTQYAPPWTARRDAQTRAASGMQGCQYGDLGQSLLQSLVRGFDGVYGHVVLHLVSGTLQLNTTPPLGEVLAAVLWTLDMLINFITARHARETTPK